MEERLVPELSGETEKNKGKKEAEEGFLHEIDVNKVFIETGLDKNGLCKLLGVGGQSIDRWGEKKDNNGNRPKYNSIVRLLRAGATTETLFGVSCKPKFPDTPELRTGQQQARKPIDHNDPEWQKLVKNALAEMKRDGQI